MRYSLLMAMSALPLAARAGEVYLPDAPPPQVQLLQDRTAIPPDQGAIFVPALTASDAEPDVLLVNGDSVKAIPVGRRVAVPPGRYVILAGTGDPSLAQGVTVEAVAGTTAIVPVAWGALRLEEVDRHLRQVKAPLQLVHVESGKLVEPDYHVVGVDGVDTWLLEPGLYRVIEPERRDVGGPNFLTVYVPASGVAHMRVFVNPRSGDLLGGGVVAASDLLPAPEEDTEGVWVGSAIVGLQGSYSQYQGTPGFADQTLGNGAVFLDADAGIHSDHNRVKLGLHLEEGRQLVSTTDGELPLFRSGDALKVDGDYTLMFNPGTGLYVRGSGQTQLFDGFGTSTTGMTQAIRELDGSVTYANIAPGDTFQVSERLQPLVLQSGAGLQTSFVARRDVELSLRGGASYRSYQFDGVLMTTDNPDTEAWEFTRVGDYRKLGVEGGALAKVRLGNVVKVESNLDLFFDPDDLGTPVIDWSNSANLNLNRVFSLNYVARYVSIPQVTEADALTQAVFLRASWSLL